jgi:hypothetical protein
MFESGDLKMSPSRSDVRARILLMLRDEAARSEGANWAAQWISSPSPQVEDPVVWRALTQIAGADLLVSPGSFLHSSDDFRDWLSELDEP